MYIYMYVCTVCMYVCLCMYVWIVAKGFTTFEDQSSKRYWLRWRRSAGSAYVQYVCMFVWCVCMYVCMYVCIMYISMYLLMYIKTFVTEHRWFHRYMYVCMSKFMNEVSNYSK